MAEMRLLIVGASGVVGRAVLKLALADARVGTVVAPTRRALPPAAKLDNPVIDFAQLSPDAPWWRVDAVICTLGTTISAAGSQAAFAAIDRDLAVHVAALARRAGATCMALNSSLGASPSGNFYLRTKAQAEKGIRRLGFERYVIVRPSLIDAERTESRPGERAGLFAARLLGPLIPRRYRPVKPAWIAHALLEGVLGEEQGERIVESEGLQR
jgi:uncharacterized protein YbjT (DUF2867 family)